jgi:y4mF family transcriptional regulator
LRDPLAGTVRDRRKALRLRQAELADLAGGSERFVHSVEDGKTSVRLDRILDDLGVLGLELVVAMRGGEEGGAKVAPSGEAGGR